MAKKWQVMYNNGQGWKPYSNQTGSKAEVKRWLADAREGSEKMQDGWIYKVFVIEETPAD